VAHLQGNPAARGFTLKITGKKYYFPNRNRQDRNQGLEATVYVPEGVLCPYCFVAEDDIR